MNIVAHGSLESSSNPFMYVTYISRQDSVDSFHLVRNDLISRNDQNVYDNFESLFADHSIIRIENAPMAMDIDFVSDKNLLPSPVLVLDYNTMSSEDQSKILSFFNLLTKNSRR